MLVGFLKWSWIAYFVSDIERNGNIPAPKSPTFSLEEKEKSSPGSYVGKMSPEKLPDALSLTGVSCRLIVYRSSFLQMITDIFSDVLNF